MSFKPKLLSRSRSGRVACVDSSTSNAKTKTLIEAEEPISNAMEKFLNNASCVVANVFSEAASMAHDMHTIITTDIDEAIVNTTTDIDEVSVGSAQDDKESAADQPARRTIKEKMKDNLPSTITFFSKPMKESRVYCETRDFFAKPMKDETREDETETEPHTETNAGQPTCSRTEAEVEIEVEVKGSPPLPPPPPAAAAATAAAEVEVEVKGSPATLAKLMKKHDKKTKQIEKLKQQLKKTEQEEVETKKRIRALAEKFRCVLNDSINGDADADADDQNQTHDDQTQHRDKTHDGKNQTHDDKSENVKSEDYQSDDYHTDDDVSESEWEDEERDPNAIDLALWLVGQSP